MLKRKENNKNKDKKSQLLIVGSLLILLGLGVIIGKIYLDIRSDNLEKIAIVEFYEEQEEINNNISSETTEKQRLQKKK